MSFEGTKNIPRHQYHYQQYISQEINAVNSSYPFLKQTLGPFKLSANEEKMLTRLEGTIPIVFQSQSYNIPISIYFSPNYPYTPPFIYVEPLPSMRIFKSQFVELDGRVTHPLISIWKYPNNANILKVIGALQAEFGKVPPIYQDSPPCAVSAVTPIDNFDTTSREWENIIINMQPIIYESLSEIKQNHALHLNYSKQLDEGRREIESKMRKIDIEQCQLESYIDHIGNEIVKLNHAMELMDDRLKSKPILEDAVVPVSSMHQDFLNALAEDEASQDTYSILNSALKRNIISSEDYLKEIGLVADKQFKDRVLSLKIIEYLKQ